ncbi:hypothetical protein RD110_24555 [Rhodoferax koreense]|uniref:Transmembrane signal peptide protein n=1 Tax=Rhodoferax koreensis TaxID=1842727 RepID=A0A1P8K1U7_9BURK|nr:RcnB family protein [Rhodoferax koreense]APW39983.1 hypothetical protein RD110_24555 [Rhodoferax koreense]
MHKKLLTTVLTALALATGGSVFAQNGPDRGPGRDHRSGPQQRNDHRGPQGRPGPQYQQAERHDDRGAGPDHNFRRGGRLPSEYRNRQYVVNDWRGHHLSAPPRGYHWVQTGGDYVLVAIATGVIAQILLGQ